MTRGNSTIEDGRKELIEEIYGMKALFKDIKIILSSEDPDIDYLGYVEELSFLMEKLEILMEVTRNENAKKECEKLFLSIKEYSEKENILEFEIKNRLILELLDLTSYNKVLKRSDILLGINNINHMLQINHKDMEDIKDKDLIFYSKLSMGIDEDENVSADDRVLIAEEILINLLDYVLTSYEKSKLPFDFYEKIMIINILDEIRLTLG